MSRSEHFQKIKSNEERMTLIQSVLDSRREIVAKAQSEKADLLVLKAQSIAKKQLVCTIQKGTPPTTEQPFIIQFSTGHEKYMAQMQGKPTAEGLALSLDCEIYLLQRREDFRLMIPRSYKAFFQAADLAGSKSTQSFRVLDLSAGGCRFEFPSPCTLASQQIVSGIIQLERRDPIQIEAEVRHIAPGADHTLPSLVGLKFVKVSSLSKDRLVAVVMDLYRELFSSLRNRS